MTGDAGRLDQPDAPDSADVGAENVADPGVPQVVAVRRKRSMWEDPVVRAMGWTGALVFVGFLMTVVMAMYYGFVGTDAAPRTIAERDLAGWASAVQEPGATADQYQSYVLALVGDKQFDKAQSVIDEVNANEEIDQSRGSQMLFALAELQMAQSDYDGALKSYEDVMEETNAAYEKELEEGGEFQNWAVATGRHDNYYLSALARGQVYRDRGELEKALEMYDIFLAKNPRDAELLVDRGEMRAETGDTAGAEADFRQALRFIADHERALAGLKKIGVEK
ncbi:MAG: tetratricopeptide repeat protein [Coriobacteriia bacterium]|jgi:tetratricopeptide (TPR) repeat protein|nr:tetratricopeptide repeat protein [Coriobacteriia bacterium]